MVINHLLSRMILQVAPPSRMAVSPWSPGRCYTHRHSRESAGISGAVDLKKLSHEKGAPGWLDYIGDEILPSFFWDFNKPWKKDPY